MRRRGGRERLFSARRRGTRQPRGGNIPLVAERSSPPAPSPSPSSLPPLSPHTVTLGCAAYSCEQRRSEAKRLWAHSPVLAAASVASGRVSERQRDREKVGQSRGVGWGGSLGFQRQRMCLQRTLIFLCVTTYLCQLMCWIFFFSLSAVRGV